VKFDKKQIDRIRNINQETGFKDISITHIADMTFNEESAEIRIFSLALSDTPPNAWMEIFEEVWKESVPLYHTHPEIRVQGSLSVIFIACTPEALQDTLKQTLDAAVAETNEKYRHEVEGLVRLKKQEEEMLRDLNAALYKYH